jgi:cyclopropane fatty-acyl-phospholipid synthase-like methyltransferase
MNVCSCAKTFTPAADLYDRMRPKYPSATFDQLAEFGHLATGSKVLEIGCGTGQATLPLAQRGYRVTAVVLLRFQEKDFRTSGADHAAT